MANKTLWFLKKMNMLNSKIMKEKQSPFMIYANFWSILVPKDNGKQNLKKSYTNKHKIILLAVMAIN